VTGPGAFAHGIALFNAGFYWEAHEVWEGLWHAEGRTGPLAALLKGLIKLAAAGVKVRQHQPHGVVTHARRAGDTFRAVRNMRPALPPGIDLERLIAQADSLASNPPATVLEPSAPAEAVVGLVLEAPVTDPNGT
jgi:predicted metal-dependent hydrolase